MSISSAAAICNVTVGIFEDSRRFKIQKFFFARHERRLLDLMKTRLSLSAASLVEMTAASRRDAKPPDLAK
jgi:hypothetical protein